MMRLTGLVAATYTPMRADGSLNLDRVGPMIDHLVRNGVTGLFVCGSTGEGPSLSREERLETAKAYVEAARLYPDAPDTQLGLGLLYESDLRQPDKARACFERFLALAPENPAAGGVRSRIERLRGTANATEAGR